MDKTAFIKAPDVGAMLKKHVKENRIYQAPWARIQGVRPATVVGYLKNPSMKIATLFTISQVLNYNFIRDIADQLPADMPPHTTNPLLEEIDLLKKENEKLKEQVAFLMEVVGVRK